MNIIASLVFLILFVPGVYGFLFIAFLCLANWLLHSWGDFSVIDFKLVFATALCFLAGWLVVSFIISRLVYFALRSYGPKRAAKIAEITLFAMFHIFAMPVLFWRMFVQNYTPLRRYYRARLKKLARRKRQNLSAAQDFS
ncbi:MAG: hypothetical protein QWI73_02960 [Alphaproteobacteria bacterium]|nr:hypothetical protein [Alphaproteobacteria bacterium]